MSQRRDLPNGLKGYTGQMWKRGWPLLVLGSLVGLFFWRSILLGQVFVPADLLRNAYPWHNYMSPNQGMYNRHTSDIIDSQYPARAVARHILGDGQLPLWDPYTSSGRPLGTLPIYALSFPLNFLLWILPLDVGFNFQAALRLFIAGAGMYGFLRQLGLRQAPSLFGGVIFAFNGFLIVWINATAGVTLSMAPLIFWACERLLRKPGAVSVAFLAGATATLISGGFIQVVLYALYALAGYLIFRVGAETWKSHNWREAAHKLLLGGLAILLGIALMAPQLWSFWEHMKLTGYDELRAGRNRSPERLVNVIRYLIPNYYGIPAAETSYGVYPELTGYVGILPLLMALLGAVFAWRRYKETWFFAFLCVVTFGLLYGAPFDRLLSLLPGLNLSSSLRIKSLIALCLAVLAALGLDSLQQQVTSTHATRRKVLGVLLPAFILQLLIIGLTEGFWGPWGPREPGGPAEPQVNIFENSLWLLWSRAELQEHHLFGDSLRYLLWILGSLVLLTAGVKNLISKRLLGLGAVCLVCLDLVGWSMTYYQPVDRAQVFPETPGVTLLQSDPEPFRVTGLNATLFPNTPGVYQLQDIGGHDPLATDRYRAFLVRIDEGARFYVHGTILRVYPDTIDIASPLLDLLNLKYIVDPPWAPNEALITQDGTFVRIYQGPDMTIYENTDAMLRSHVVFQAEVVTDSTAILDRLANGETDPRETILIEEQPPQALPGEQIAGERPTPEIVSYTANRVVVQIEVGQPAFLVLGDMYYPGWEAYLDGQPTKIYQANYLFRAVFLPPGAHTVEFVFLPRPYYLGLAIRWGTLIGLVVAAIWEALRKRSAEAEHRPGEKVTP